MRKQVKLALVLLPFVILLATPLDAMAADDPIDMDVLILYDYGVLLSYGSSQAIGAAIESGLDTVFGQYYPRMNFHIEGFIYDHYGYNGDKWDHYEVLENWPLEWGWPDDQYPKWTHWGKSGPGLHGSYYEFLVMMTNIDWGGIQGLAVRRHNVVLLDVSGVNQGWSYYHWFFGYVTGVKTAVAHEVGHSFGLVGDSYQRYKDVMDYYWSYFDPYNKQFCQVHRNYLGGKITYHCEAYWTSQYTY